MTILETERLTLRKMNDQDEDHLMMIFSDPIAMQYYKSTKTREEARKWINWNIKNYEIHHSGLWICELKGAGAFIGQCGIVPQIVDGQKEMEIGYLFVRDYWGQGYATEAASAVRDYGWNKLQLSRLISMINKYNTPSIKVAERIGMSLEKEKNIKDRPTLIYSIHL
ncbi:GNAT family N-acetyltransferase [Alkalihalobacterium elongatum]|uniref:GNAT family N-acetyltransferase n=1 Tax=Alkalihalobacterium elongatum TaxID=2675466 RepID=UPI001C200A05|nr:GNAT family N-acetyltransferase [Alkalihalobacterium elongatum]